MHADSKLPPARVRAGGTVLSILAAPLSVPILRAHLDGPLRLPDLRERIGGAAQTTLRGQVGNLRAIGALERHVRSGMPYTVVNTLTPAGSAILGVAEVVDAWLMRAPQGPIAFGSEPAKAAIRAVVSAWGSTMLRALAARPLSLTDMSNVIEELSYPALERRLTALRAAGQVQALPAEPHKATPYAVTEWTRQAVAPLVAAGRCECEHLYETTAPLTRIDIEAAFLLAVPLVHLEAGRHGACLLAVDTGGERKEQDRLAGVRAEVEDGEVTFCDSQLEEDPRTWALGTVSSWVKTILDGDLGGLRIGGADADLAEDLIRGLHATLHP